MAASIASVANAAAEARPGRRIAVIGGGFAGLSAAYELAKAGHTPIVLEADASVGGLGGGFAVGDVMLERFYHHWFTSDRHIMELIEEIGTGSRIVFRPTRTGMFYANSFYRLSSPLDVLRFAPLSLVDRLRLGLLVLRVKAVRDWRALEAVTAKDWLISLAGREVYRVVWEPLLIGKFGSFAEQVSAVWFWKKIALRGGSRAKGGAEQLAYYSGGFAALADALAGKIRDFGGEVRTASPVTRLIAKEGRVVGVRLGDDTLAVDAVIATPALPIVAGLVAPHVPATYVAALRRIDYLANVCLVLELDRPLSDTYWLNVNDASFPFVAIIEHTNFEPASSYAGRHIVYLSKYLRLDDPLYRMDDATLAAFALPHIQRMFPKFSPGWIKAAHVWRAEFAQPIVVRDYSQLIPARQTPLSNLYLCSMAQIYPEDRGTNYAVREGREVGRHVAETLGR